MEHKGNPNHLRRKKGKNIKSEIKMISSPHPSFDIAKLANDVMAQLVEPRVWLVNGWLQPRSPFCIPKTVKHSCERPFGATGMVTE